MRRTPLEFLPNFSKEIGRELWMKRDDCNGDVMIAGNKQRKLRLLLADAKSKGADTVLTSGGPQSNHARAMAAMAIKEGLKPVLVLGGSEPTVVCGNYLLNKLLGVEMHFTGAKTQEEMADALAAAAVDLEKKGKTPYVIPVGGSNGLGACAYVEAYNEFKEQSTGIQFDWLFVSAGSGGTLGGILLGKRLHKDDTQVVGISPWLDELSIREKVRHCMEEARVFLNVEMEITSEEIHVSDAYIGAGYGIRTLEGIDALHKLARTEAVLLDYVYTSKAMAGCLDYISKGYVKPADRILFWHTGGAPSVFTPQ